MSYVTGISGNVISAASAGYAPTNSADVSAIASAYQVVSSTSTQLYAGTAFLTSVNDAPVSASRAGNAANAGMANSAYYDGTGRLISSLPDSAAVSSIASSYAESAASGKLDTSASSSFYTVDNPSGFITGVDLSEYATTGYVDSAVSGKQDTLTFAYDADSAISSINGSALAGGGGGATGDYVEKSAMEVAIGSGNTVSSTAFAQGADNVASGDSVAFGVNNTAIQSAIAVGGSCSANYEALAVGQHCTAWEQALAVGGNAYAINRGLAVGNRCTASLIGLAVGTQASAYKDSVAVGEYCSAKNTAVAFGKYNLHVDGDTSTGESAAFVIGDGEYGARHDLMLVTKDGEITMYSSTADTTGTGIMSSIRAISAAATGGGVDSATVSAIASSYAESAASGKLDSSASSSFYSTANESGFITGLPIDISVRDLSASRRVRATATGEDLYGNFDYAGMYFRSGSNRPYNIGIDNTGANFYIATAKNGFERIYVSSIQSWNGKLDGSASSSFYTTANESGFINSAYVDSAVSGKADSSALSSYALSADVSGTVDLVSTQSANWGGSALALSAGPGISLTMSGNTLVASTDETVLWENYTFASNRSDNVVMSEDPFNFSYVRITFELETTTETWPTVQTQIVDMVALSSCGNKDFTLNGTCVNGSVIYARCSRCHFSGTAINDTDSVQWYNGSVGTMVGPLHIYRIVGINRTAEA